LPALIVFTEITVYPCQLLTTLVYVH